MPLKYTGIWYGSITVPYHTLLVPYQPDVPAAATGSTTTLKSTSTSFKLYIINVTLFTHPFQDPLLVNQRQFSFFFHLENDGTVQYHKFSSPWKHSSHIIYMTLFTHTHTTVPKSLSHNYNTHYLTTTATTII